MGLIKTISANRVKITMVIILLMILFTSMILMNMALGAFIIEKALRLRVQKIIFLYSTLNTVLFGLVGYLLLHYLIIRPINQLRARTEKIKEIDELPFMLAKTSTPSEIGELTDSFVKMIRRIEDDRRELKNKVEELKKLNQELRQAQSEVIRSERLASIGRLSSGIAHEIGNPVGIVLGYIELLRRSDISDEEKQEYLIRTEKEMERIQSIIKQLLDYARQEDETNQRPLSVHNVLKDTIDMLTPQKGMKDVNIIWNLNATMDMVTGTSEGLKQVFLNIFLNAIDAVNNKMEKDHIKEIKIETSNDRINGREMIVTKIKDNGSGIRPQDLPHIFEPFFTTKAPGQGTGLGLSVSRRIIENMGGDIEVQSAHGQGTCISVIIPVRI